MRTWHNVVVAAALAATVLIVPSARGQALSYRLERIASGLRQPVYMDQAPGDPANIIYYMTRTTTGGGGASDGTHGSLYRYNMDTRVATEVMNLSHRNLTLDLGPQGFAFHPDFNTPGAPGYQKLYVSSATTGGPLNYVEEFVASGPNGTVPVNGSGQPVASRLVMQYTNVTGENNHVIDWIGFDPRAYSAPVGSPERDYLFISAGDGSNGQPAQNRPEQKANSPMGKLLRVDVNPNNPDFYPSDPLKNFAIPTTNPIPLWNSAHGPNEQLVGTTLNYTSGSVSYSPALPEMYFTGTRNTFRMSQDRVTGAFYSADVGEVAREEINFMSADPYDGSQVPFDFGFPQREGMAAPISGSTGSTTITWNLSGGGTAVGPSVNPIQEGPHATLNSGSTAGNVEIRNSGRSAYIGGYVYRGPIADLQGQYFYSDFVHGNIFSLDFDDSTPLANFNGANGTKTVVLNRNLNSLWHQNMVDTADPNYTPALGTSFGIGRVVSFGEDNAGNMYIIDMGGTRGNSGFSQDYPGGTTGQIFRLTSLIPQVNVTLTVDRESGELTLTNSSGAPIDLAGYSITSSHGAIDVGEMIPITGNYDFPIPPGDGSIDSNNAWQITSSTSALFSEQSTGDQGTLAAGATKPFGEVGAWVQSIYEDWTLQITLPGGGIATGTVAFTGNDGLPFDRSDLDFDGEIEPDDWLKFRGNYFGTFSGLSAAQSYEFGDLDGDGDNDYDDYRLFRTDYIAANGLAAFEALGAVPEPGTLGLIATLGALLPLCRRRRGGAVRDRTPRPARCPACRGQRTLMMLLAASVVAVLGSSSRPAVAALKHQYTFNGGVTDSVGTAHGTLFGNATTSAGQLVLPGGAGDYLGLNAAQIGIASYTDLTIESWFTADAHMTWARLFDFGNREVAAANQGYISYVPQQGGGTGGGLGIFATPGAARTEAAHSLPAAGTKHHLAFVIDDNANGGSDQLHVYMDGALAVSVNHSRSLSNVLETFAYLGRSLVAADPYFDGSIDEFRIHDNAFSLAAVQASFAQGPTPLVRLRVNTVTGEASLVTDSASPITFNYYEVRSVGNQLNTSTWLSLDDQNFDPAGPGVGEGWEEADQSNSSRVAEFFLQGDSNLTAADPLELGRLFNPAIAGVGVNGDLTIKLDAGGAALTIGGVEYFKPTTFADFNVDGRVDGRDFLAWQRGLGKTVGVTLADGDADFDGDVDAADLALWRSAYGSATFAVGSSVAAGSAVPEPAGAFLWATGLPCALAVVSKRRR
jgi:hypothetical protein